MNRHARRTQRRTPNDLGNSRTTTANAEQRRELIDEKNSDSSHSWCTKPTSRTGRRRSTAAKCRTGLEYPARARPQPSKHFRRLLLSQDLQLPVEPFPPPL